MEEKIVENKKEDLPSLDLFHSLISIASLIYQSIYLVCVQSTTPLWFTDISTSDFTEPILDVVNLQCYGDIISDILQDAEEKLSAMN